MRLICTISTEQTNEKPYAFSLLLTSRGIENECESIPSDAGASTSFRIWVYEEDFVTQAQELYHRYRLNPKDPSYAVYQKEAVQEGKKPLKPTSPPLRRRFLSPAPYGPISILILLTVCLLFVWAQIQRGTIIPPKIPGIIQAPLLAPVERSLIYDYPFYFETRDKLFTLYTPEEIEQKKPPSTEARQLIQELKVTSSWMGIYERIVVHFRNHEIPLLYEGTLFQKISQGEVWRLFTPALLHFDLLHIFFNVLWFILLGNQIEFRLGWGRYLLLILMTGLISNTAQYLMSGPFFMGLSGIICGMAAFIWARQQIAPWEGYLLHRFTLIFLASFVVGMFVLQVIFFFMQIMGKSVTIGIANTAHLSGGLVGYLLGRLKFFAIHVRSRKKT